MMTIMNDHDHCLVGPPAEAVALERTNRDSCPMFVLPVDDVVEAADDDDDDAGAREAARAASTAHEVIGCAGSGT